MVKCEIINCGNWAFNERDESPFAIDNEPSVCYTCMFHFYCLTKKENEEKFGNTEPSSRERYLLIREHFLPFLQPERLSEKTSEKEDAIV